MFTLQTCDGLTENLVTTYLRAGIETMKVFFPFFFPNKYWNEYLCGSSIFLYFISFLICEIFCSTTCYHFCYIFEMTLYLTPYTDNLTLSYLDYKTPSPILNSSKIIPTTHCKLFAFFLFANKRRKL